MDVSVPAHLAFAAQLSLGLVFLLAVLPKLRRPRSFARSTVLYEILPFAVAQMFGLMLIPLEGFLVLSFLSGWLSNIALPLAAVLLCIFLAAVGVNLRRGRRIPCGCFGEASEPISLRTVARLLLLLAVVLVLLGYRTTGDPTLPNLGSMGADVTTFKYLVQAAALSAFFVLVATWVLNMTAVLLLVPQVSRDRPLPTNTDSRNGLEGA